MTDQTTLDKRCEECGRACPKLWTFAKKKYCATCHNAVRGFHFIEVRV